MHESKGKNALSALRKKWRYKALLSRLFIALAVTIFTSAFLHKFFFLSLYWSLPCLIVLFLFAILINPSWKFSELDVSKYLNITQPLLEESTHLILRPEISLNLLEKLQVKKVEYNLLSIKTGHPFKRHFTASLIALLISLISVAVIFSIPFNSGILTRNTAAKQASFINPIPEIILPGIRNATIIISPPSYTGNGLRQQRTFNLLAEEGAIVSWQIQTNVAAKELKLIFNDGKTLLLTGDMQKSDFKAKTLIRTSGFYQVKIDNNLSEFYTIEAIKDQPPAISIQSPKPNTFIAYGLPEKVMINAIITDDYGIGSANITATVSSGRGEEVKFTEQKLLLQNFTAGNKSRRLQKLIDGKLLGMVPGDELYFFISAADNHNQQIRSDVYIITLQDTNDLMNMNGMEMSLDIKPQLFRSQRQIIIETEQLLKDKAIISIEKFREKSNNLGIDQKLLRLRYGKFLGEETHEESGIQEDHIEHQNNPGNTEIPKKYGHEHDNAEDATFYDALTKKQLKATLTEMWDAELKLSTFLPKEALPYEYKALQLLKDLQQKSRVYVQKTGIKVSPLNQGKRLTGDLSEINPPVTPENLLSPDSVTTITRKALGILEQLKHDGSLSNSSKDILQKAFRQLSLKAGNQPAVYLISLSALKKILDKKYSVKHLDDAEEGLQKMTAAAERFPTIKSNAGMNLSRQYFINLHKVSKP